MRIQHSCCTVEDLINYLLGEVISIDLQAGDPHHFTCGGARVQPGKRAGNGCAIFIVNGFD